MNTPHRAKVAARILATDPARFDAMVRRGCILLRHEHNPDIPCTRAGKCTGDVQSGAEFGWGDAALSEFVLDDAALLETMKKQDAAVMAAFGDELPVNVRRKKSQ